MRLYLSSFRVGNAHAELVKLSPDAHVGVIMNALDNFEKSREKWLAEQLSTFADLAMTVEEVDLRKYFNAPEALHQKMMELDMVWVNGGNTFVLRRAMRTSGFDYLIKDLLAADQIVYAGFSAGVVILAPSLHGLEMVDDPADVPEGYVEDTIWEGLDILPHAVVVHYKSDHSEFADAEKEVEFYENNEIAYRTLRDGEAFVVDGDVSTMKLVGHP